MDPAVFLLVGMSLRQRFIWHTGRLHGVCSSAQQFYEAIVSCYVGINH